MKNNNEPLERVLTLPTLVLFGMAYITPLVVFAIYGVLSEVTRGAVVSAYLITIIALLFTAYSYTRMMKVIPTSGSAYTYVRKGMGPNIGFMIGWILLLDYLFMPMANAVISGNNISAGIPGLTYEATIVMLVVASTLINIIGIKLASKINSLLIFAQFIIIAIFIILSIYTVLNEGGTLIRMDSFFNKSTSFTLVIAGSAIAAFSFLGFDSISTLAEETINPKKTLPKATILIVLFSGVLFVVISYFSGLVHPEYSFQNVDASAYELFKIAGGNLLIAIYITCASIGALTAAIATQAAASRLLYVMGRDSVLPERIFGYLHPKYKTPVYNILISGAVALTSIKLDISTSTSFINFGGFTAFTFVNLSVIFYFFIKGKRRTGKDTILYLIIPLVGAFITIWLWTNLDGAALTIGGIWTLIGLVYLLFLTKILKKASPELRFDKVE